MTASGGSAVGRRPVAGRRRGSENAPAGDRVLCRLDEIAAPGSKGIGDDPVALFVVRDAAGRVFAYANRCPHTGGPLDWVPDQFLTRARDRILCATHGAEFRITDGHCLRGPCAGAALAPVAVVMRDGLVLRAD